MALGSQETFERALRRITQDRPVNQPSKHAINGGYSINKEGAGNRLRDDVTGAAAVQGCPSSTGSSGLHGALSFHHLGRSQGAASTYTAPGRETLSLKSEAIGKKLQALMGV